MDYVGTGLEHHAELSSGSLNVKLVLMLVARIINSVVVSLAARQLALEPLSWEILLSVLQESILSIPQSHLLPQVYTIATYTCGGINDYQTAYYLVSIGILLIININFLK